MVIEHALYPLDEQIAGAEHAAAQDQDVGIEEFHVLRDGGAKPAPNIVINLQRHTIAAPRLLGQQLQAEILSVEQAPRQTALITTSQSALHHPLHSINRYQRIDASTLAAATARPARRYRQMTDMTDIWLRPAFQFTINDERGPHNRIDRQKKQAAEVPAGPEAMFARKRRIDIDMQARRQAIARFEETAEREFIERRQRRHQERTTRCVVNGTRNAHTYATDRQPLDTGIGQDAINRAHIGIKRGRSRAAPQCFRQAALLHTPMTINERDGCLTAPDLYPYRYTPACSHRLAPAFLAHILTTLIRSCQKPLSRVS